MDSEDQHLRPDPIVELREVTADTVRAICNLQVGEEQKRFVAPNAVSIAQAYFEPKAWFRAVYADETPVGFAMLYLDPDSSEFFLWRFMIDARYQGLGIGSRALELLFERVRTIPGASELRTSCVPKKGGPEPFYTRHGFKRTGKVLGEEVELRLEL